MYKYLSLITVSLAAFMMSGCCCGPYGACGGGGIGECTTGCNDCEGVGVGGPPMAYGPIHHLTQMRKSLVCGTGCGEVYYGEWRSTPPDACDPCCDDQFVGGAVPCRPFCWQWQPGQFLFGKLGSLYGKRFCEGCGNTFDACGCNFLGSPGHVTSHCGCDGSVAAGNGGSGCATCNSSSSSPTATRIAAPPQPTSSRTARMNPSTAMQRGVSSSYAKPPTQYR